MSSRLATFVTSRARLALGILFAVTIGLALGMPQLDEQADTTVFLPDDSDVAQAMDTVGESFPDSAGLVNVTLVHRGDVLTPEGLAHNDAVIDALVADPDIAGRLAVTDPILSLSGIFSQVFEVDDLSTLTQQQIDAASQDPRLAPAIDGLTGEADGTGVATSQIRLRQLGDPEGLEAVELRVAEIAEEVEGPLSIRSLSSATINAESDDAVGSSMTVLLGLALVVIAVLLLVFFRTGSDVVLSLSGLGITIVGTLGFQGLVGPNGLGLIGAPNQITTMVPVMLVGLVVDYSIQSVARYRELRTEGMDVVEAARRGLRGVMLPLGLAAITTMVSFLTNVASPIPANKDFGVVAAFGVFFGLFTMLTLVPAARTILDQRRAARGRLTMPATIADAIPGAGSVTSRAGDFVARRPVAVLAGAGVVTLVLAVAATGLSTEFDTNDFLPGGGESVTDLETLEEAFGGQSEVATILVEAELTDDRTLRNLFEVTAAFSDDLSRPDGAAGPITASLGALFEDWNTDSGEPGDNYDPMLAELTAAAEQGPVGDPAAIQAVLDRLEANDPIGFAQVAVNDPNGTDVTLMQFSAITGDQDRTAEMVEDIEGLWFGDRDQVTTTSGEIIALEVTSTMTDSQSTSIALTIVGALIVLVLFFWLTEFKPMLAVIAVLPIVLVLLWVLGTMALLGIPYNVVTALITALSIGIGVDYTIHVIHRFTEEMEHTPSLREATTTTLATTGSALVGSALTTALAFAVLLFSPLVPFQQFGIVTGITIVYALLVSIVVVPPMLVVWAAYHRWRQSGEAGFVDAEASDEGAAAAQVPIDA